MIQINSNKMYTDSQGLEADSYTFEGRIIKDLMLFCEDNRIDPITQEGIMYVIKNNFQRERLGQKNRL